MTTQFQECCVTVNTSKPGRLPGASVYTPLETMKLRACDKASNYYLNLDFNHHNIVLIECTSVVRCTMLELDMDAGVVRNDESGILQQI